MTSLASFLHQAQKGLWRLRGRDFRLLSSFSESRLFLCQLRLTELLRYQITFSMKTMAKKVFLKKVCFVLTLDFNVLVSKHRSHPRFSEIYCDVSIFLGEMDLSLLPGLIPQNLWSSIRLGVLIFGDHTISDCLPGSSLLLH